MMTSSARTAPGADGPGFSRLAAVQARVRDRAQHAAASGCVAWPATVVARCWHVPSALGVIHQDHDLRLWLALADGRFLVFRLHGVREPDDALLGPIAAAVNDDWRGMVTGFDLPNRGTVAVLYAAPVMPPAPQHGAQESAADAADRAAVAACAAADVLALLATLECDDPDPGRYRSVRNHNRLVGLPGEQGRRRVQALARFPALVAPLLLTRHQAFNLFNGRRHARREVAPGVEAAIDAGRDLTGALAGHYGISRSLVRSPFSAGWWPMARTHRHALLHVLDALPAHRRPRDPGIVTRHGAALYAVLRLFGIRAEHPEPKLSPAAVAGAFRAGFAETLDAIAALHPTPALAIDDTRDFIDAAAHRADWHLEGHHAVRSHRLVEAWLAHYGLVALVDASLAWHRAQRWLPTPAIAAAESDVVLPAVIGRVCVDGRLAVEISCLADLIAEGEAMRHCVATYWNQCLGGDRIVSLTLADGERGTAHYRMYGHDTDPRYALAQLRGPDNIAVSAAMQAWADHVEALMNAPAAHVNRIAAAPHATVDRDDVHAAETERRMPVAPLQPRDERRLLRLLDRMGYTRRHRRRLLLTPIAGWAHHAGPSVEAALREGDALTLVREPHNPHDPRAIRIDRDGTTLGYIPRAENSFLAVNLDEGTRLCAHIARIDLQASAWGRVVVEIQYAD